MPFNKILCHLDHFLRRHWWTLDIFDAMGKFELPVLIERVMLMKEKHCLNSALALKLLT